MTKYCLDCGSSMKMLYNDDGWDQYYKCSKCELRMMASTVSAMCGMTVKYYFQYSSFNTGVFKEDVKSKILGLV